MAKKTEKTPVSFWGWFLTLFMIAIPCVGFFYMVCGAIFATNESRRNFYRAHLAWFAVIVCIYLALFAIGSAPDIRKLYDHYQRDHHFAVQ
jgi:hypothetical protein